MNPFHLSLCNVRTADAVDRSVVLTFEEHAGSREAVSAVVTSENDVAVGGAATILREREAGRPIVPLAVLFQRLTVMVFTTRECFGEPFEWMSQLRSCFLGIPTGTETGVLGRLLLEQANLRESVELVAIEGEERSALGFGKVDAVTGMFPDPYRFNLDGRPVDIVAMADQHPTYGLILVTTRTTLRRRRSILEAVLAAAVAGRADALCDGRKAAKEVAATAASDSPDGIRRTFCRANDRFEGEVTQKRGWGWHTTDEWVRLRTVLPQGGMLEVDDGIEVDDD